MVKPIALQDNLGKTRAAERIAQLEKSQPELAQRETKDSVQRKNVEQQKKTTAPEKGDEVIIHRDHQQEKDESEKKKKDQQSSESDTKVPYDPNPDDEGEDPAQPRPGSNLDVQA